MPDPVVQKRTILNLAFLRKKTARSKKGSKQKQNDKKYRSIIIIVIFNHPYKND
jgi:hypothetical protein